MVFFYVIFVINLRFWLKIVTFIKIAIFMKFQWTYTYLLSISVIFLLQYRQQFVRFSKNEITAPVKGVTEFIWWKHLNDLQKIEMVPLWLFSCTTYSFSSCLRYFWSSRGTICKTLLTFCISLFHLHPHKTHLTVITNFLVIARSVVCNQSLLVSSIIW